MNPYVADPDNIPPTDTYADVPYYGRYLPRPDDFQVNIQHINSHSPAALEYWASVVDRCNESLRISPADEGGRDVFALGSVIIKSSHLHNPDENDNNGTEIDYSSADANEVEAIAIAENVLSDIRVPRIFFTGKLTYFLDQRSPVACSGRLPGVSLTVAWPYLSQEQKQSFKEQARSILRQLHSVKPNPERQVRGHVVEDPNICSNGRIHALEGGILFSADEHDDNDFGFMHNDFTESNCIVDHDEITGLIDWEMAGFFGWKIAGRVHSEIRTPQREHFVNVELSEDRLQDIMFWNDLYEV